ncbi:desulfoferrodoxin [bacterium]
MATEKLQVYKCEVCGNIAEMIHAGAGKMICCGQPMAHLEENTVDAAQEKHVPVVEKTDSGIVAKVGSVAHPMEAEHYIEWIEVIDGDGRAYRKFLNPGDAPEAEFCIQGDGLTVREYCNLHGVWKSN